MLKVEKILFPTDFSEASKHALDHALIWAELYRAELVLLHILALRTADPFNPEHHFPSPEELEERMHQIASSETALFLEPHSDSELTIHQFVRTAPEIERGVLDFAEAENIDLLVLGSHGRRGAAHLLMGSIASELLRRSTRPVLVVPSRSRRPAGRLRRILAAVDFSSPSKNAARHAHELAATTGARLELFHVLPDLEVPLPMNPAGLGASTTVVEELEPAAQSALSTLADELGGGVEISTEVWHGPAAATILNRAVETDADLIVLATLGHTGLDRLLLGSVAERVARLSECPVLVVPERGRSLLPVS